MPPPAHAFFRYSRLRCLILREDRITNNFLHNDDYGYQLKEQIKISSVQKRTRHHEDSERDLDHIGVGHVLRAGCMIPLVWGLARGYLRLLYGTLDTLQETETAACLTFRPGPAYSRSEVERLAHPSDVDAEIRYLLGILRR